MLVGEIRVGYTSSCVRAICISYWDICMKLKCLEFPVVYYIHNTHITFINCCDKRHMFVRMLYSYRFASTMLAPSYDLIVLHDIVGFLLASLHTHTHTTTL